MPNFSKRSEKNLEDVDDRLVVMCKRAIRVMDFSVIEGHRSEARQNALFDKGMSKLKYPHSKHNTKPSLAIDCVPYPIDWQDQRRFYQLAGVFKAIAHSLGFEIRHGGDWDRDDEFKDQKFFDLPHFEIYESSSSSESP